MSPSKEINFDSGLKGTYYGLNRQATQSVHGCSTANSPHRSWTTDIEAAKNYALRGGKGSGAVLTAQIPNSQIVKSPNTQNVNLKQSAKTVSEAEVLVSEQITGAKVESVNTP